MRGSGNVAKAHTRDREMARVLVGAVLLSSMLPGSMSAAFGPSGRLATHNQAFKGFQGGVRLRRALMAADPDPVADDAAEVPSGGVVEGKPAPDDGIMTPWDTLQFTGTICVYILFFFAVAAVLKQFTPPI